LTPAVSDIAAMSIHSVMPPARRLSGWTMSAQPLRIAS
jgi:hypothetical protein